MSWRRWLAKIGALFCRRKPVDDLEEEIRSHLAMEEQENRERGMSPDEAHYAALRRFGNVNQAKERSREMWGWQWLETVLQDLRYGLRQLRRNPSFTAVAVLTLALGIGSNTAIFSLLDAVMLRSLPVHDPSQLVLLRWTAHKRPRADQLYSFGDCDEHGGPNPSGCSFPYPFFQLIQSEEKVFSGVTAFAGAGRLDLSGNGPATRVRGEEVSGEYFSTLGVRAAIGRTLGPNDDSPSAPPAAVLSYAFWQSAFGGDRSVVGRTITLNSVPFTIVGVAEQSFTNLAPGKTQDMWVPIAMDPRLFSSLPITTRSIGNWWLVILARLKPGITIEKAQAAASVAFRNEMLHGEKPLSKVSEDPKIVLVPAQQGLTGLRGFFSKPLYVLMFAVGFILLIACANVASLLLSRATGRQKEMAVRLAVGAGRARIVRQLLTESVCLSLAGGALGALFAYWGVGVATTLLSSWRHGFPFVVGPDGRVLAFTITISLLSGVLFGLTPALRISRLDLTPALEESAATFPTGEGRLGRTLRLGKTLAVAQVVLSVIVLVGAALLVRTLQDLRNVNPGFDTRNVLLFTINPTVGKFSNSQFQSFCRKVRVRLAALPGVLSASYSSPGLLGGAEMVRTVHFEGQPEKAHVDVDELETGPDFLATMRIPLLAGRTFADADFQQMDEIAAEELNDESAKATPPASADVSAEVARPIPVLANQAFVRKYFPGQNPLGRRLTLGNGSVTGRLGVRGTNTWEIIGITGDAKYRSLRQEIQPTVYVPITVGWARFEVRTAKDPLPIVPAVRHAVEGVDRNLILSDVETQSQSIEDLLGQENTLAQLSGFFALLALMLACIGLYGLLSFEASRRTHEIGIRMALGAEKRDVLKMVVGQGLKLALIGVAIGIAGALALTRFLASLLYGVKPTDPITLIVVSLILIAVALLACYIPARRAANVDPMVALRYE